MSLLILLIYLTGPAWSASTGDEIAEVALRYRDQRPKLRIEACNGLIEDVLRDSGYEIRGNVRTLFATMKDAGWVHRRKVPHPGDVVFFDNTYDSNRNGKQDDPLSHVAIVTSVDEDGTVHMVHRGSKGIRPLLMNLHHPSERRAEDGKVLNSWLGQPGYAKEGKRLSGELWRAFATPHTQEEPEQTRRTTPTPPPVATSAPHASLPMALTDDAFVRAFSGQRLRPRHLDGRSCAELWFLRNAIFARHGYPFQNPAVRQIFADVPAYRPKALSPTQITKRLKRRDRRNLDAIMERERRCR
ncbi:MAG: YARHG domain-containing protein [Deltaproteobacteria bacterium]|nr:MAG: YARHG domain-containing protein [Deltaproteobacteria bacterium]